MVCRNFVEIYFSPFMLSTKQSNPEIQCFTPSYSESTQESQNQDPEPLFQGLDLFPLRILRFIASSLAWFR